MADTTVKFTYQDLLTAPDDGNRYEIFEGELIVTPSPVLKHQNTVTNLTLLLGHYVKANNLGRIYTSPVDVYFDDETVFKPDLLFVSGQRSHILEERRINGAPDLIVEVLSPGTADRDRGFKFRRYEKEGVKEYWLADPIKDELEIHIREDTGYKLLEHYRNDENVSPPLFPDLSFQLSSLWE